MLIYPSPNSSEDQQAYFDDNTFSHLAPLYRIIFLPQNQTLEVLEIINKFNKKMSLGRPLKQTRPKRSDIVCAMSDRLLEKNHTKASWVLTSKEGSVKGVK